ncbi:hypothetical protein P7K49_001362 [Saguinus oedipus]|uniref:Kazal-like domain-containing protein n=1 Tax=Saguinus oedipus TaxID=9490 RepID=A0ABQ9WF90_SAGOE|nr:hypothetical protein P7K49_001362 [Saguinus oedipus]
MSWGNTQSWQEFDRFCEYNPVEVSMLTCLADVREPCQLGCRNLTYCTNFNNRVECWPTELFRSCNAQSDQGAMNDMKLWEKGSIKMPFINIPVLDIKKCQPEIHKNSLSGKLQKQVMLTTQHEEFLSAKYSCQELEEHVAISLTDPGAGAQLLDRPSTLGNIVEEVTHPCNPNPCPANELCEVNRKGCVSGDPCLPYSCVQVLFIWDREQPGHGTSFSIDCNVCSCFAGNLVCSTRLCLNEHSSEDDHRTFTGLPCNCADQFVPVCGQNGRTYPSACIARCVGLQDHQFEFGSCMSKDPCNPNPCQKNQREPCIVLVVVIPVQDIGPKKNITNMNVYQDSSCVTRSEILFVTQTTWSTVISAFYTKEEKASLTKAPARETEPVCGHNGETYSSVCAAYSDRVAVDYYGDCQAVGVLSEHSSVTECAAVKCPLLSAAGCKPIIPPVLEILQKIRMHVSVPQCDVFGYFSIESEIVILIIPVDHYPKALQIEACNKEAEKIESLINSDSPTLASHVPLSALIISQGGRVNHSQRLGPGFSWHKAARQDLYFSETESAVQEVTMKVDTREWAE